LLLIFLLGFLTGALFRIPTKTSYGKSKKIASWLALPNSDYYTGHAMRRTAATIIADRGGDTSTLKRFIGWRSSTVAEGYVARSKNNQREMANTLAPKQIVSPYFTRHKRIIENEKENINSIITTPKKNKINFNFKKKNKFNC